MAPQEKLPPEAEPIEAPAMGQLKNSLTGMATIPCWKRKRSDDGSRRTNKFACVATRSCCSGKSPAAFNYQNFLKSALPRRIMFYSSGAWVDFPQTETRFLVESFGSKKSAIQLVRAGVPFLLDFVSMVLINLKNGHQASIAWIDENDKCFFPAFFIGGDISLNGESEASNLDVCVSSPYADINTEANSQESSTLPQMVKEVLPENAIVPSNKKSAAMVVLQSELVRLETGSEKFISVMGDFLSGMGTFADPCSIVGIYQVSPKVGSSMARFEMYTSQLHTTNTKRGGANVRNGWFGTSKKGLFEILARGFREGTTLTKGAAYGTGIYFAPGNRSFSCTNHCDVDEKGLQYMLLCQVIMGNMEQVPLGSGQHLPSKPEFDCGVDDILRPKRYVVWETLLDTNIHLEFIISFKLTPVVREYFSRLVDIESPAIATIQNEQSAATSHPVLGVPQFGSAPSSPWASFVSIIQVIGVRIPLVAKELLSLHYQEYKQRKIPRAELIWRMRVIVGDKLLMSVLGGLQKNPSLYPDQNDNLCSPARDLHPQI